MSLVVNLDAAEIGSGNAGEKAARVCFGVRVGVKEWDWHPEIGMETRFWSGDFWR